MTTSPKESGKSSIGAVSASLSNGTLVQYEDDGQVFLASIIGLKKDKLLAINHRGRELELGKGRMYPLPGREPSTVGSTAARTQYLATLATALDEKAATIDVGEIWSFVHEELREYTVKELSELYFGSDTLEYHAALRIALIREKTHFKRDKENFEPRAQATVEELKKAEDVKRKKLAARGITLAFLQQRISEPECEIPFELQDNFCLMAEVAANVQHLDAARQREGKELVSLCATALGVSDNNPIEKQAFTVLLKVHYFQKDTNLSFIRNEIPLIHGESARIEADQIVVPDELSQFPEAEINFRTDLTRVRSVTIDDISTKDMDDALSIEQTVDGYQLGIHITDVAWAVPPGSALDRAAKRRATSIYCADGTINMLPEAMSEAKLSLWQGAVRPCLSCLVNVDRSYKIIDTRVVPSFIRSAERYTYDQVDELLESGDPTLLLINDIAAACEAARIEKGAIKVHKREVVPFVDASGTVRLQEIDEDSPARALVAEMMVFGNSIIARFASDKGIPFLFRGQERPEPEPQEQKAETAEGPAKDFGARTKLKKSTVGFVASFHSSLGLDAYAQATSPIRRYMDLCHQRQLISYFKTGKPWLTQEDFEPLAFEVENYLQAATLASRETKRFWLQRYLEQRGRDRTIEATVVRTDQKSPLVELDEVYLTVFVRTPKSVKLGDRLTLRLTSSDPHTDYVRFEVAS